MRAACLIGLGCYVAAVLGPINGQCLVCDLLIIKLRNDTNSTIKTVPRLVLRANGDSEHKYVLIGTEIDDQL